MKECKNCKKEHDGSFGSGIYCSRSCANKRTHSITTRNKMSLIGKEREKLKPFLSLNKGKELKERIISICLFCNKEIRHLEVKKYHHECYLKCSGGYRQGSGHGKGGWYKCYWSDSSYELAYIIYNLEHGIKFERNTKKFDYINELGKKSKYIPDFILEDGSYIEIKGFESKSDKFKWFHFPFKLTVLFEENLKEQFKYVVNKYGLNFIELYDNSPHSVKNKECLYCGKPAKVKFCSNSCGTLYHSKLKNRNN